MEAQLANPPSLGPLSQQSCVDSLHPVKAVTDELELVTVQEMQLHVELVFVQVAIQNQLIRRRAFESEVSIPVFAAATGVGKRYSLVANVNRGTVIGKRVIRALKGHGTPIGIDVELPDYA